MDGARLPSGTRAETGWVAKRANVGSGARLVATRWNAAEPYQDVSGGPHVLFPAQLLNAPAAQASDVQRPSL
ncbi:hypothetical protein GCM10010994_22400 [Chelatococcus reniformis]|uniref:Uncharacterized protein n=1 Tax=Chelatococcus reniformis TaxID=1494448 RepID=A0A916U9S9_9HYPH|nr:hypothetical protein GCM10010994_22400 [Chelatococcus reniformis]